MKKLVACDRLKMSFDLLFSASILFSTVAAILRSTVIGSQSVKGCEGFKPIILFIWCHVRSASFIIFARVEGVLVSRRCEDFNRCKGFKRCEDFKRCKGFKRCEGFKCCEGCKGFIKHCEGFSWWIIKLLENTERLMPLISLFNYV